jgi:hypothetical protein
MTDFITICPHCYSSDITSDFSNAARIEGGLFGKTCNRCGFTGNFFPEIEVKDLPVPKELKDINAPNQTFNDNYSKNIAWLYRITGPLAFLLFIIFVLSYSIPFLFYTGFLGLLPLSITLCIIGYKQDWIKKYLAVRIIFGIIFFYSLIIAPIIIALIIQNGTL